MRYYKIKDKKIINTITTIPKHQWKVKGILPVEVETKEVDKPTTNEIIIKKNKVVDVRYIYNPKKSLDELKKDKIKALKVYLKSKFPELYEQNNAMNGFYSEEKNKRILTTVKKFLKHYQKNKKLILTCESEKELTKLDYRTKVDIEKAKEAEKEMEEEMKNGTN